MTSPLPASAAPPLWMPLAAGLVLGLCLLVMSLPVLGHERSTALRLLFLGLFLAWVWPLSLLQRELWHRAWPQLASAVLLLVASYGMALTGNLASATYTHWIDDRPLDWSWLLLLRGRGVDGLWLALIAQGAVHAMLNHGWALQTERLRAASAQHLAREAQLRALRYQLQPHFLFNALNTVSSLIALGRPDDARATMAELGGFLRSTLDDDARHEVALAEELASADAYLAIERKRLGSRLSLDLHVEPGLLAVPAPRWLLQPLIENAVRHGIAPLAEGGRLALQLRRHEQMLELVLENDAPPSEAAAAGGIGLANVRERLEALYPGAHSLDCRRPVPQRFRVCVRWPVKDVTA